MTISRRAFIAGAGAVAAAAALPAVAGPSALEAYSAGDAALTVRLYNMRPVQVLQRAYHDGTTPPDAYVRLRNYLGQEAAFETADQKIVAQFEQAIKDGTTFTIEQTMRVPSVEEAASIADDLEHDDPRNFVKLMEAVFVD